MNTLRNLLSPDPTTRDRIMREGGSPLLEDDYLQEAQVIGILHDAVSGNALVVLELRQALQIRDFNTAVIVARGTGKLEWSTSPGQARLTAWWIESSKVRFSADAVSLSLVMSANPGAGLELSASSIELFLGDIPGLDESPPSYVGRSRSDIGNDIAGWDSTFDAVHAFAISRSDERHHDED